MQTATWFFDPRNFVLDNLCNVDSSLAQDLEKRLMELNVSLLTTPVDTWSGTIHYLLVYCTGVLTLDVNVRSATRCSLVPLTTILSSLLSVSLLLFLEYA